MKDIITEFNDTGICKIDIYLVIKKWNHLWRISQWNNKYTLIKYIRKDSPLTDIKVQISDEQSAELIKVLNLVQHKSTIFRHGSTWK